MKRHRYLDVLFAMYAATDLEELAVYLDLEQTSVIRHLDSGSFPDRIEDGHRILRHIRRTGGVNLEDEVVDAFGWKMTEADLLERRVSAREWEARVDSATTHRRQTAGRE